MRIEDKLKDLIIENFGSLKNFAERSNVPRSTLTTILKRGVDKASVTSIINICKTLGIDTDELAQGRIVKRNAKKPFEQFYYALDQSELSLLLQYRKLTPYSQETIRYLVQRMLEEQLPSNRTIQRPVFLMPASAGSGQFLDSDDYEVVDFPEESVPPESTFAVRVSGNSMLPEFHDGSIVFVKQSKSLEPGEIGIFLLNGEGYLKKLGERQLISLNPDYENIKINKYDDLRIVGKVVGKYEK